MSARLIVALWAAVGCSLAIEEPRRAGPSDLSRAAAAQLERLASFPRTGLEAERPTTTARPEPRRTRSPSARKPADDELQLRIPIDFTELFRILGEASSQQQPSAPRDKRNDNLRLTAERMRALDKYADRIMQDERVQSYISERIKRDGGFGSGSGSSDSGAFVSGLAGQLVGSVVGLASSASKTSFSSSGSAHNQPPVYGPPVYHSYGKDSFSIWDFKKAILNTLIQAVKAIGGSVLALKGQLIKGGGFLVSTKGRIISSAGEALSGVGKSLASSALVQPPPQHQPATYHSYGGYAYEAPAAHVIAHDTHYNGPPPSPDAYHHAYTAASDDDSGHQPGLLIAKPTPTAVHLETQHPQSDHIQGDHIQADHIQPDHISSGHIQTEHHQADYTQTDNIDPRQPNYNVKDIVGHLTGSLNIYQVDNVKQPESQSIEDITPIPGNTLQLQDHNQDNYELYPPLGNGPPDDDKTAQEPPKYEPAVNFKNPNENLQQYEPTVKGPHENPQKYEYPPANYQNAYGPPTKYGPPNGNSYSYLPPKPHYDNYQSPDIQIEISNHDITGFESGGFLPRHRHSPGLHVMTMQGPLKIPILGPNTYGLYKNAGFPPAHVNSIAGIGKYPKYGPGFEVQQSIKYELRNRRDGSTNKIYRI